MSIPAVCEKSLCVFFLRLPEANSEIEIKNVPLSKNKNSSVFESGVDGEWPELDNGLINLMTMEASTMDELATFF